MNKEARITIGAVALAVLGWIGFNYFKKDKPVVIEETAIPEPPAPVEVKSSTFTSGNSETQPLNRNSFGYPLELNNNWKSK